MKYALVLAGATLVSFAQGQLHRNQRGGIHARQHAHDHAKKDVVTTNVVEWVTVTVTAGVESPSTNYNPPSYEPPSSVAAASSSISSSISNAGEKLQTPSQEPSQPASSAVSSSVAAAPTSIPSSSTLVAQVKSSSSSVAASSAVSSSSSSTAPSASGISLSNLIPNGKKAGLSGYEGIQKNAKAAFSALAPHISWYSDYTATTETTSAFPNVMGIPMLWGASGSACNGLSALTSRLNSFMSEVKVATEAPKIMFGFYEPDCTCTMSSDMSVSAAATAWNSLIAPLAAKGTILGSPSMCKQKDEDFLTPFKSQISTTWDVTSIHVNKNSIEGVKEDVEYYVQKYGKPVFVSEFACVDDKNGFTACTDQGKINTFINQAVAYFEGNKDVIAYGASNGEGLGDVWPLTKSGDLTETGKAYLKAISSY